MRRDGSQNRLRLWGLRVLLGVAVSLGGCGGPGARARRLPLRAEARPSETTAPRPLLDEATIELLGYNILFEYRQVPRADGSYAPWVCSGYPYVVDHPELRWESRRSAVLGVLDAADADVLGLTEMRGGHEVPLEGGDAPPTDPSTGAPTITDVTVWLRDHGYRWVSVETVPGDAFEEDAACRGAWPGPECSSDMSANGCSAWDPSTDAFSTRGYIAYRAARFELLDSGAVETPTANARERRFAPWARLRDRASGLELAVAVAHLDPRSGPHRVAAARRLRALAARLAPTPTALLGDFNALPESTADCRCCQGCDCSAVAEACAGESAYGVLTSPSDSGPALRDTLLAAPNAQPRGTVVQFTHPSGTARWSGNAPCWPRADAAPGRGHVGPVVVQPSPRRVDYVFASDPADVVSAEVIEPASPSIQVAGEARNVTPSDHLPVRATLRLRRATTP